MRVINKALSIVHTFTNSTKRHEKLLEIQNGRLFEEDDEEEIVSDNLLEYGNTVKMLTYNQTRWTSLMTTLERLMVLKPFVREFYLHYSEEACPLNDEGWVKFKNILDVLNCCKVTTKKMEHHEVHYGNVLLLIRNLRSQIYKMQSIDDEDFINKVISVFEVELNYYFSDDQKLLSQLLCISIDPELAHDLPTIMENLFPEEELGNRKEELFLLQLNFLRKSFNAGNKIPRQTKSKKTKILLK